MSSLSPQRCLNRQSVYSSITNEIAFMCSLRLSQIISILEKNLPQCEKCKLRQKNHYCMQANCDRKMLLCINCDIKSIDGNHYLHDFTYLIPLFSQNVFQNFNRLKDNFLNFHECLDSQLEKINKYLQNLNKVKQISLRQLDQLAKHEEKGRYRQFLSSLKMFIEQTKSENASDRLFEIDKIKIEDVFKNVNFISEEECAEKEEKMRKQLMQEIDKLEWMQNPQRTLTEFLKQNQLIINSNSIYNQQSDIFISSKKKIIITEIDSFFRNYNQFFTQNLQHHKVEIKIDSELLSRQKFYEAFIYHFRSCQRLIIDNANITHLKTPLSFRKLKELEFNCNVETDTISNCRIENQNEDLECFTIRKFREDDIKILKFITGPCKRLKNLHVQFFNKTDLTYSRDLVDYLTQQSQKNLNAFVLKMRTQNQVKRLYGYLSKFNRQTPDQTLNLNKSILHLLKNNQNLTKIVIEGVKGLDGVQVMKILFEMKFLMQYKIYFENINLMAELDNRMNKVLEMKVQKKKRIFASLTKMTKDKLYPVQILRTIGEEFLD